MMRMPKVGLGVLLFLFATMPLQAADFPRFEVFGGFSHLNSEIGDLNGFGVSLTSNANDWFSLVSDYSGHFGKAGIYFPNFTEGDFDRWYFMAGPQFNARVKRLNLFGRVLFGVSRNSFEVNRTDPGTLQMDKTKFSEFAMGAGLGMDVHLADHFGIRFIQADWIRQFGDRTPDDWELRLGTGVLVTF